MDDLTAFLNARLDEDEAAALAAGGDSWHATADGVYHEDIARQPGPFAVGPYDYLDDGERAHIALHDPARVLREVEAKRAIITQWERSPAGSPVLTYALSWLAAAYSDHPDYRPEWKP